MIRAVLFDLDDTLIDRAGAFGRLVDDLVAKLPPAARTAARATLLDLDAASAGDRDAMCRRAAERIPALHLTAADLGAAITAGIARFVEPAPAAASMLASIASRMPVAIVTNGSGASQRAKIASAKLPAVPVVIGGEIGAEKPDRRIFDAALRAAGADARTTLFVGDDPVRDVGGAHAAGMRTCWLGRGAFPAGIAMPDWRIRRLADLREVLPWT